MISATKKSIKVGYGRISTKKLTKDNKQVKSYVWDTQLLEDTKTKQTFGVESQLKLNDVFFSVYDGHLLTFSSLKVPKATIGCSINTRRFLFPSIWADLSQFAALGLSVFLLFSRRRFSFRRVSALRHSSVPPAVRLLFKSLFCFSFSKKSSPPCFNNHRYRLLFSSS